MTPADLDAEIIRALNEAGDEERQQANEERALAAIRAQAEAERPKLTRVDCVGAKYVRDEIGWRRAVRVNAKSVTVPTSYSFCETIPFAKLLEVRR